MSNFVLDATIALAVAVSPVHHAHVDVHEVYTEYMTSDVADHSGAMTGIAGFTLDVSDTEVRVSVRVAIPGAADWALSRWERSIEKKWNGVAKFEIAGRRLPVVADVQWVTPGTTEQHSVELVEGRTADEGHWCECDPVGVTHEFGHMLGNKDEYFTVDGVDYTHGHGVMHDSTQKVEKRHYEFVRAQVQKALGTPVGMI